MNPKGAKPNNSTDNARLYRLKCESPVFLGYIYTAIKCTEVFVILPKSLKRTIFLHL